MSAEAAARAAVERCLAEAGVDFESPSPGSYLVRLPGRRKLATWTWLVVGAHSVKVEAFFCRRPDENHAAFYRWLLEKNARMYGVRFALDPIGDVYLTGHIAHAAVGDDEVDRVLGAVLEYSDDYFNPALELGFGTAIRKEWAWRTSRGESTRNLEAFRHLAEPAE
ncbi:YbjN domain-containing protein [Allonocardiopsis opalescens]|uniref:Putative sensory transduction regulator n=1 Tax=Allonocardiopsis opalescens TaxID=1144618 RepID=A0A2T0QA74_9ACTN|nr:YbjN domain-containing protein [Allonocardiopsis opalescens]PRY00733.1 putative sensory transduction regulator [Allonocardiopsis opalescens]